MAEMIPDRLPAGASRGEEKAFAILKNLPDDCIVYYEPIVAQRFPDFIVISPRIGVLIVEAKGWYAKHIMGGDLHDISLHNEKAKHPMRQAREYMYALMDACRKTTRSRELLNKNEGEHEGKFIFPFGNMVVLNNIERHQLQEHKNGDMTPIFPDAKTLYREEMEDLTGLSPELLELNLKKFFDPWWKFSPLQESQINVLRSVLHPEINISDPADEDISLKVLDLEQEKNALNIGEGHRLVRGVAGSGKTLLLIARAKLLSLREDKPEILMLCYNVSLAAYLKRVCSEHKNIHVFHFDGWAKSLDCTRKKDESNDELGERLLLRLEDGLSDMKSYQAVMIDEAQDFAPTWFKCVLEVMTDRDDDLLIVGDANQKVFQANDNTKIVWKNLGINIVGRSTVFKINYRNTRKILKLAALFSNQNAVVVDEGGLSVTPLSVDTCKREGSVVPIFVECKAREEEIATVVKQVRSLLANQSWQGKKVSEVMPSDIGILYRHADQRNRPYLQDLITQLQNFTDVVWLSEGYSAEYGDSRQRVGEQGVKIQTVHSAKGLQYKVVIVIWADQFPATFADIEVEQERNLFYVALTRPEDYLMITATGTSSFTEIIKKAL